MISPGGRGGGPRGEGRHPADGGRVAGRGQGARASSSRVGWSRVRANVTGRGASPGDHPGVGLGGPPRRTRPQPLRRRRERVARGLDGVVLRHHRGAGLRRGEGGRRPTDEDARRGPGEGRNPHGPGRAGGALPRQPRRLLRHRADPPDRRRLQPYVARAALLPPQAIADPAGAEVRQVRGVREEVGVTCCSFSPGWRRSSTRRARPGEARGGGLRRRAGASPTQRPTAGVGRTARPSTTPYTRWTTRLGATVGQPRVHGVGSPNAKGRASEFSPT